MKSKFDGEVYNITISEHSSKLTKNGATLITLKDTEDKKYSFFAKKMDGNETAAFKGWSAIRNPVGAQIEIGVKEEQGEFEGKPFTRRKVMFLKEVAGSPKLNDNGTYAPGEVIPLDEDVPF